MSESQAPKQPQLKTRKGNGAVTGMLVFLALVLGLLAGYWFAAGHAVAPVVVAGGVTDLDYNNRSLERQALRFVNTKNYILNLKLADPWPKYTEYNVIVRSAQGAIFLKKAGVRTNDGVLRLVLNIEGWSGGMYRLQIAGVENGQERLLGEKELIF